MIDKDNISQFFWFMGIVEDRQDPLQMGRVRVRTLEQTKDKSILPTSDLPWAQVVVNNSASMGDVGVSATGYVEGSLVVGFYIDGFEKQKPVIFGSIPGFPQQRGDKNAGHSDPRGVYPKEVRRPDVNSLARNRTINEMGDKKHPSIELREKQADDLIGEPIPERKTVYPYASVMETESGHIQEFDDTLGSERICTMHRTGTMYEMHHNGDMVTHVAKDNYSVIMGSDSVRIRGDVKVYVDGDSYLYVRGDADMQVEGNFTHNVKGDYTLDVGGNISITTNGFYHLEADDEIFNITNANYFLNAETGITASTNAKTFLHSKDTFDINTNSKFTLKSKNTEINAKGTNTNEGITLYAQKDIDLHANEQLYMQADIDIDMNAGNDIYLKAYSDIWHKSNIFRTRYVLDGEFAKISRDDIGNLPAFDAKSTDSISINPASSALIYNSQPLNPLTNFIYDRELQTTESGNLNVFGVTGSELFYESGTGGAIKTVTNNDKARAVVPRVGGTGGPTSAAGYPANKVKLPGVDRNSKNYYIDREMSTEEWEVVEDIVGTNLIPDKSRININTLDAITAVQDPRFKNVILNGGNHFKNDVWHEINGSNISPGIKFMWNFIKLKGLLGAPWCAGFASFILLISGNTVSPTAGVTFLLNQARAGSLGKVIVDTRGSSSLSEFPVDDVKLGDLILLKQNGSSHATFFAGYDSNRNWLGTGGNQGNRIRASEYGAKDYTRRITAIVRPKSISSGEDQPLPGVGVKVAQETPTKQTQSKVDPQL